MIRFFYAKRCAMQSGRAEKEVCVKFSILVVCLNAGEKLQRTVDSIIRQTCTDYEIVIKDGGSTDGSLNLLPDDPRITVVRKKDSGIYDAMNQATREAQGDYVYFLNCGDVFHDKTVLQKISDEMNENRKNRQEGNRDQRDDGKIPDIVYGNIYDMLTDSMVSSNPSMDAFGCYRNVPCHQACFYKKDLVLEHPFSAEYQVRADYEQFLWCFFKAKAALLYVPVLIADYEGGGFSESKSNLKKSALEHKKIVSTYMTKGQLIKYKAIMILTLAGFRTYLSHHPVWGKLYNNLKKKLYRK